MKKHGFVPPNLMGKDFDDEEVLKEEMDARSSKDLEKAFDDTDDKTNFEIAIVNKANQALCIDAMVSNGEVSFNKPRLLMEDGLKIS